MSTSSEIRNIPISRPYIGDAEKQAVMAVLDSGQLIQGRVVADFEAAFAEYCGVRHAIASVNGTTALTIALMAAGVGADDEVIIPSFTFVATATSVLSVGAKPIFVDVEGETFCMDASQVEAAITPRTKAIMPVHLYGHPANLPALQAIAEKHGLVLVEDAAQAHGAAYQGQRVGSWGVGAFSFYPSKNMTSGEGGMTTTNDDAFAQKARMVRNHGMSQQYLHEIIGFNFRMTNIHAAIGLAQMDRIGAWTSQRQANAAYLSSHLESVRVPVIAEGCEHVFHQYTVLAPEGADREGWVKRLNDRGIGARVYYPLPVHQQPIFREMGYGDITLPVTDALTKRVFSLPVHPALDADDLAYLVHEVNALS
jgi:perosamine synthetase